MTKFFITVTMALAGLFSNAQIQETRKTGAFTGIEVQNGIELIYTQGEVASVKVETDDYYKLTNIITECKGKTLKISMKEKATPETIAPQAYTLIKVYVTQKDISTIKATAGASVRVPQDANLSNIAIDLEAGASFTGNINCTQKCSVTARSGSFFDGKVITNIFNGDFKGGAAIKLSGAAKTATIFSNTGAACMAGKFICDSAVVDARRTSSVTIKVIDAIKAETDTSASITYYGSPADTHLGENCYAVKKRN